MILLNSVVCVLVCVCCVCVHFVCVLCVRFVCVCWCVCVCVVYALCVCVCCVCALCVCVCWCVCIRSVCTRIFKILSFAFFSTARFGVVQLPPEQCVFIFDAVINIVLFIFLF